MNIKTLFSAALLLVCFGSHGTDDSKISTAINSVESDIPILERYVEAPIMQTTQKAESLVSGVSRNLKKVKSYIGSVENKVQERHLTDVYLRGVELLNTTAAKGWLSPKDSTPNPQIDLAKITAAIDGLSKNIEYIDEKRKEPLNANVQKMKHAVQSLEKQLAVLESYLGALEDVRQEISREYIRGIEILNSEEVKNNWLK